LQEVAMRAARMNAASSALAFLAATAMAALAGCANQSAYGEMPVSGTGRGNRFGSSSFADRFGGGGFGGGRFGGFRR
jgi:hypothetical protein